MDSNVSKVYTPYLEHGALRDARVFMTPQVRLWYNHKKTKRQTKEKFSNNVAKIIQDIRERGRPYSGHIKTIVKCEVPIFYMRLNDKGERIHFDWKRKKNGEVEIKLLSVSNKKNIQKQLEYSAEHKVHSSTLDLLEWEVDGLTPELNLASCTEQEILEMKRIAKQRFGQLPPSEIDEGWNEESFNSRMDRATIYDYRFPNLKKFDLDEELPEILKLHSEQEKILEEQNQFFLLEGVAGTGKTTILLYRFVGNVKAMMEQDKFQPDKFLFVTHNERLKIQIMKSLRYFFDEDEMKLVSKSVKSVSQAIKELIGELHSNFDELKRLTRKKFKKILAGNKIDTDLFWEEYRGILRGYNLNGEKRILEKDVYLEELGRRRGKIDYSQREEFYSIASDLEKSLSRDEQLDPKKGGWDDLDLCKTLQHEIERGKKQIKADFCYVDEVKEFNNDELNSFIQILYPDELFSGLDDTTDVGHTEWDFMRIWKTVESMLNKNGVERKLDFLYIDEVQDLTTAELDVFLQLLNPNGINWFAAAGDLSQSVQPSAFTWQSLRDLITKIVGIHVKDEYRLDENFRSTPHLVNAANRILDISKSYSGQNKAHLQRPIKGENEGEPMFIFEKNEAELLDLLDERNLPNSDCLLLTRDEQTKRVLKEKVSEERASFVETIARYKGLEDRDVLLWDPCSGSENILDLIHHPKRGEQTKEKVSNITSGRLELNFLFVALTRARYLLGILAPKHKDRQHFLHHAFDGKAFCSFEADDKLQIFGSTKMDSEHYLNRARNLVENRNLSAAAGTYRQIGMMHEYHFYKAEACLEEENYPQAVIDWGKAIDFGDKENQTGELSLEAQRQIAEYSTLAIKLSNDGNRNDVKACIRIHAYSILPETARNKFKGDDFFERGNFKEAARYYFQAGERDLVNRCLTKFEQKDVLKKIELLILIDRIDDAESVLKSYYKKEENVKTGIKLAMSSGKEVDKFFSLDFDALKPRFTEIQPEWAKEIARSSNNSNKWMRAIDQMIEDEILSKPVETKEMATKHLQIFKQKKNKSGMENLRSKVLKSNLSSEILQSIDRELIRCFGSMGDAINFILKSTQDEIPKLVHEFVDLKENIERRPMVVVESLKNGKIGLIKELKNIDSTVVQKLIALSILVEYEVALQANNEHAIFELLEKLQADYCMRTKQSIVQGCASLIGSHIVDQHHPIKTKKIEHHHRINFSIFKMLYFDKRFDKELFQRVILNYIFHPNYKRSKRIDGMNSSPFTGCINLLKQESRLDLYWRCRFFEVRTGSGPVTPGFISNSISVLDRVEVSDLLDQKKKSIPKLKITKDGDDFIGPYLESAEKLVKASKTSSKWFAKLITADKKYNSLWASIFIDAGEEKGSLDDFNNFMLEDVEHPSQDDLVVTKEINDSVEEPADDDSDNLVGELFDDEFDTLTVEEDNHSVILTETFLTDEIKDLESNGKNTIPRIKEKLSQIAGEDKKEVSDFLYLAFNTVFEIDWPVIYQFAVLLSIWEIDRKNDGYPILADDQKQTFQVFKNKHFNEILGTRQFFSQRVAS